MAVQQLGVAGMTLETRTFYDKVLLSRTIPNFVHRNFGVQKSIAGASGNIISFRRFTRPSAQTTALTEGTPGTALNPTVTSITATIAQYGAYMLGSDLLEWQAIDPVVTEFTQVFGENLQDTLDQITRNVINAGTTVAYASTATVRSGLASGMNMSWAELRNARRLLKNQDVLPLDDGKYAAIVHPDVVRDLFSDSNVTNSFQYAFTRTGGEAGGGTAENPLSTGALGDLLGIRFYETTNATITGSLGQSGGQVYGTLFVGKEAYAVIELSSDTARTYFKPRGSSGINDPLDQIWSLGWKAAFVAVILDQNRIVRYESRSLI